LWLLAVDFTTTTVLDVLDRCQTVTVTATAMPTTVSSSHLESVIDFGISVRTFLLAPDVLNGSLSDSHIDEIT